MEAAAEAGFSKLLSTVLNPTANSGKFIGMTTLYDHRMMEGKPLLQRRESKPSPSEITSTALSPVNLGPISNKRQKRRGHGGKFYIRGFWPASSDRDGCHDRHPCLRSTTRLWPTTAFFLAKVGIIPPAPLSSEGHSAITFFHCLHDLVLKHHAVRVVFTPRWTTQKS